MIDVIYSALPVVIGIAIIIFPRFLPEIILRARIDSGGLALAKAPKFYYRSSQLFWERFLSFLDSLG